MDLVAVLFYRKKILWKRILPLLPGTITGVTVASLLFIGDTSEIALSDRWLMQAPMEKVSRRHVMILKSK